MPQTIAVCSGFFQHMRYEADIIAQLVIGVLGQTSPRYLALDRTA